MRVSRVHINYILLVHIMWPCTLILTHHFLKIPGFTHVSVSLGRKYSRDLRILMPAHQHPLNSAQIDHYAPKINIERSLNE